MSFDLGNNPPSDTLRLLARYFSRLCTQNTPDELQRADPARHCTSFHARVVPPIDLHSYLVRILKYCPCANEVFISLAVYARRLEESGVMVVDRFNVHRLCISGVVVASKYFSDIFFTNSRYAKVGGLPVSELNSLEIKFMELLNYRIHVTIPELQMTGEFLSEYRPRPNSIVIPAPIVPPSQPPTPSLPIDISQVAWRTQTETPVSSYSSMTSPGGHDRPQSAGGLRRPSDAIGAWTQQQQQLLQQRRPKTSGHQRAVSYHPTLPSTQGNYGRPQSANWRWSTDDYANGALSPEAPVGRHRANTASTGYTSPIYYDHSPVNTMTVPMQYYHSGAHGRTSQRSRSIQHQPAPRSRANVTSPVQSNKNSPKPSNSPRSRHSYSEKPSSSQAESSTVDEWVKRPIPLNVTKQVNALENSSSAIYQC